MSDIIGVNEYTRFMVEAFDESAKVVVPTAFQGGFFGIAENGAQTVFSDNSESIEIDIIRANGNRLARLVNRGTSSDDSTRTNTLTTDRFTNVARVWPLIENKGAINSNELLKRVPGETPYAQQTREDRMTRKAIKINMELIREQLRLHEYLAREAILTGSHPAILGTTNTDLIYDFYRKATHTFAAGAKWDVVGTDIIGDFDTAIDLIQQDSNNFGDYGAIIGASGMEGLRKNTQMKAEADIRRYEFVELGERPISLPTQFSRYIENGFALAGKVRTYKNRTVYLFTYDLTYTDDFTTPGVDTETPWMPVDKALVFTPNARCDKYFGPPDRLPIRSQEEQFYQETFGFNMTSSPMPANIVNPGVIDFRAFYFDAYEGADHKAVTLRAQSAGIFPSTETDAFVTITGLV
jgi:hypothetical protein